MTVKIRLQRHGRKHKSYYHIVVADSRSPRDGKYLHKIGTYNPNTNPTKVSINVEDSIIWLNKGAIPTNRVKSILTYSGVFFKRHLLNGVKKNLFTLDVANSKFNDWLSNKNK
jgi:small subunit ribosomal protein S16